MRKLIIALLVLIIVVAALLGFALYNIDSLIASYKDRIIGAAERRIGRKVAFDRINVKFRGGVGVRIRGVSIAEDPAFGTGHFLKAADVQVNLGIRPLRREISVTRVVLHEPAIQVIRNAQGVYNFTGLDLHDATRRRSAEPKAGPAAAEAAAAPAGSDAEPRQPRPGETAGSGLDFAVARVEVSEGVLDYRDKKDRHHLRLRKWDLKVDDLRMDRPFKAELAAAFLSDRQNIRFNGSVGPLGPRPRYDTVDVDGTADVVTLSWAALRQAFPRIEKAWPAPLDLTGTLQSRGLSLKGNLEELKVTGTVDLTNSALQYGDLLNKPRGTVLRLQADARATPEGMVARGLDLTLDKLSVKGQGDVSFGSPTAVDLSLEMADTELGGWVRWMPLLADYALSGSTSGTAEITGTLDSGAVPRIHGTVMLRQASAKVPALERPLEALSAAVEFSNHGATFRQLSLRIGKTRLAGAVTLESLAPPVLTYRLASPSLHLADLGLQPEDTVLERAQGSGRLAWSGGLSWEGSVTAASGRLAGFDVTGLTARLGITGPWLVAETLRLTTLGGALDGNGRLELGGESPRFDATVRLRGIDIKEYLGGIAGFPDVEGRLDADLQATGQGRTWDAIRPTLKGTGKAAVVEGRVLDFNLAERALQGLTGVTGLASLFKPDIKDKYPHIFKNDNTSFEKIDTEVEALGDRIVVAGLTMRARDYDIVGKGSVTLDGGTDLNGVLTVSEGLSSDLLPGSRLTPITNDKGQLKVPLTLRGTIPHVRLQPRLKLIQTILEKSVGRGLQGLLDLVPGKGAGDDKKTEEKPREAGNDLIRELIDRALKVFGADR